MATAAGTPAAASWWAAATTASLQRHAEFVPTGAADSADGSGAESGKKRLTWRDAWRRGRGWGRLRSHLSSKMTFDSSASPPTAPLCNCENPPWKPSGFDAPPPLFFSQSGIINNGGFTNLKVTDSMTHRLPLLNQRRSSQTVDRFCFVVLFFFLIHSSLR